MNSLCRTHQSRLMVRSRSVGVQCVGERLGFGASAKAEQAQRPTTRVEVELPLTGGAEWPEPAEPSRLDDLR